jgi:hypothetical protein
LGSDDLGSGDLDSGASGSDDSGSYFETSCPTLYIRYVLCQNAIPRCLKC